MSIMSFSVITDFSPLRDKPVQFGVSTPLIHKQFFLNTHDDRDKALKNRCLGTWNRTRILDRLKTMTYIQGAQGLTQVTCVSRPEF